MFDRFQLCDYRKATGVSLAQGNDALPMLFSWTDIEFQSLDAGSKDELNITFNE
jgi:hypothetical protein